MPSEVSELETTLCRFSEIVERSGKEQAPHYIATYLIELARVFNAYYAKFKIVDTKDEYSPYKVVLTSAFTQVMKNGLEILGIRVPERMELGNFRLKKIVKQIGRPRASPNIRQVTDVLGK